MADGLTLQGALSGMAVAPTDNYYGIGTQVLGQALPGLVNPYGNFGTNLSYVLGGALLQGLLGYQARQEANRQNLEIGKYAAQMTALPDAAARVDYLNNLDADSQVMSKLTNLQSALQGQEATNQSLIQQQIAQKKALAPIDLEIQQAQARGMTLEEYAKVKPVIEQLRQQKLAAALSSATNPQQVTRAAEELTAQDLIKRAETLRPTAEDTLVLSPTELKQKQDQYEAALSQGRALLQLEREKRVGESQIREANEKANTAIADREQKARNDKIYLQAAERLEKSQSYLQIAQDALQNPNNETVQKLIKLSEKPIEENQVTLSEFKTIASAQPLYKQWKAELEKQLGAGTGYDPTLIKNLHNYLKDVALANQATYEKQLAATAKAYKIEDPGAIRTVAPMAISTPGGGLDYIKSIQIKYGPQWKQLATADEKAKMLAEYNTSQGR